ncbi:MAG TPA: hypothetical protein VGA61_00940 [Anaerolineae bacterium]
MQTGLLWYDSDPHRGLTAKVEAAAHRYQERFGSFPNTCYVNQTELSDPTAAVTLPGASAGSLRVLPARNVLPHHFWVGVEESTAAVRSA